MISEQMQDFVNNLGYTWRLNCWGATLMVLQKMQEPEWVSEHKMQNWLDEQQPIIPQLDLLQKGDIVAMYDAHKMLVHTATYEGNGMYWHKPGAQPACIQPLQAIVDTYLNWHSQISLHWYRVKV